MLNAVFDGFSQISYSNLQDRFGFIYDFKDEEPESNLEDYIDDLYHNVDSALQDILDSTVKISSFIKAFRTDEFNTVYSEREWRALSPFYFNEKDIAFIIVPKQKGCYKELCRSGNLWGKIPVLPWEDLLEY